MQDHLIRVVSKDGLIRGAAAVTTQLVTEICKQQGASLTATVALGRLLTGGALLGCLLKGQQRMAIMVEGNGPLGKMSVETDASGRLRGTIRNPSAELPPKNDRFDIAGAVGRAGFLHVWKDLGLKKPYQSMVQLQSSEIAEDLAWYLTESEQVPSCVSLGVELDGTGHPAAAGGFMIQALPPGDDVRIERLVERVQQLPPVTTLLRRGQTPEDILLQVLEEETFSVQETGTLEFLCPCTRRQIEKMLLGLGVEEVQKMIADQEVTAVTCEYCRKVYNFASSELEGLLSQT